MAEGNDDTYIEDCCQPFCLPYNDPYLISAQVLALLALLMSWHWWVTFVISAIAAILLQILWCCRQRPLMFVSLAVVSSIAALMCLFAGVWYLVVLKRSSWCLPFIWESDDDDYYYNIDDAYNYDDYDDYNSYNYDDCNEKAWAIVGFVNSALWFAVAGCLVQFVCSGRHARWEAKRDKQQKTRSVAAPEAEPVAEPVAAAVDEPKEEETKEEETKEEEITPAEAEDDVESQELKQVASA
eukprot:jgi/Psemu1/33489/gm1.33489_g